MKSEPSRSPSPAPAVSVARSLRGMSNRELRERITSGYPVDPAALEGWAYRGTNLAPALLRHLSWTHFQKTFYRDPASGRLLGWNVRTEQEGLDAPSRPKIRRGKPVTVWHYEVVSPEGMPAPRGFDRGLIIDYSRGKNPRLSPIRLGRDPLVALTEGNYDELLGVTYEVVFGLCLETPTYFTLEREHRLEYVPALA